MIYRTLGWDPSLRNWGIAAGTYCSQTREHTVNKIAVTQPVLPTGKQVRQNSKDLVAGNQLAEKALASIEDAQVIFVEVPVGSQSSRAMASYGICVGVLAALRAFNHRFVEVTPTEVKMAAVGKKTATKREMIQWAYDLYPDAGWPMQTKKGVTSIIEGKAEHMADAIAAIHAGVLTEQFNQLIQMRTQ
jgi:Holliday junction resolvasome RuvABC endonuclease subunit